MEKSSAENAARAGKQTTLCSDPVSFQTGREIEELVFQNGRWSWTEKDEEGFLLHEQMIRGGRVDMAAKAAERIREKRGGRFRPLFCMGGISGLPAGQVPAPAGEKYAGKRFLFAAAPKSWQSGS